MSDRESDSTTRSERKGWREWIAANPVAAVTLAGLALYGSLRLSAGVFYGRLGFQPEEVGLGYSAILARSLYGLVVLFLFLALVRFVLMAVFASVRYAWTRLAKRKRTPLKHYLRGGTESIRNSISDTVLLAFFSLPVMLAFLTGDTAVNRSSGQ